MFIADGAIVRSYLHRYCSSTDKFVVALICYIWASLLHYEEVQSQPQGLYAWCLSEATAINISHRKAHVKTPIIINHQSECASTVWIRTCNYVRCI